jgi:hypothetical protein
MADVSNPGTYAKLLRKCLCDGALTSGDQSDVYCMVLRQLDIEVSNIILSYICREMEHDATNQTRLQRPVAVMHGIVHASRFTDLMGLRIEAV